MSTLKHGTVIEKHYRKQNLLSFIANEEIDVLC